MTLTINYKETKEWWQTQNHERFIKILNQVTFNKEWVLTNCISHGFVIEYKSTWIKYWWKSGYKNRDDKGYLELSIERTRTVNTCRVTYNKRKKLNKQNNKIEEILECVPNACYGNYKGQEYYKYRDTIASHYICDDYLQVKDVQAVVTAAELLY